MRFVHLLVIGVLVFAAAYVYRIKMDSTARTETVLKLRAEIHDQRDAIAALRSEWAKLDAPARLQGLSERHLDLKAIEATQFDRLRNLPMRPQKDSPGTDLIGAMIDKVDADIITGSLPTPPVPGAGERP